MLLNKTVIVGTPIREGSCDVIYKQSQIAFVRACMDYGITAMFKDVVGESEITKARNILGSLVFREPQADFLLMWDGDIGIRSQFLIDLIRADLPVVAAPCPKKEVNWDYVRRALALHPEATDEELAGASNSICINMAALGEYDLTVKFNEPLRVLDQGAGVMLIRRDVLEKMAQEYPDEWYYENYTEPRGFRIFNFFQPGIDKETRTWLSEDYAFCRRWLGMGGAVHLLPWIRTQHAGRAVFSGNLIDMVKLLEEPETVAR